MLIILSKLKNQMTFITKNKNVKTYTKLIKLFCYVLPQRNHLIRST